MNEFRNVPVPVQFGGASAPAKYSNSALVLFSPWDFSFEFSQLTPSIQPAPPGADQQPQVQVMKLVQDWITMSPPHAKAFLRALGENVARYEDQYGVIPEVEDPTTQIGGGN
jgi:hypothetical protein